MPSHIGVMTTNTSIVTPERLWSIEDLAEFLAVPVNTVYRWRKYGGGPRSYKVGKHVRFQPAEVAAWLEEQAQEPEASPKPAVRRSIQDDQAFWAD